MTTPKLELLLWIVTAVAVWRTTAVLTSSKIDPTILTTGAQAALPDLPVPDSTLADAARILVDTDPFRLNRTPPSVAFGAKPVTDHRLSTPPLRLTLHGVVGGPPWRAVIDGIPGKPTNTVVAQGATIGSLVVVEVGADSVVIQTPDTVLTLFLSARIP